MDDTRTRIRISRQISSRCDETWFVTEPIPENWANMDVEERFDWINSNVDDVYTHDEWPEDTLSVETVEVENE